MKTLARASLVLFAALAAAPAGCAAPSNSDADGGFVPFARNFQGFESWPHQTLVSATATGSTHVSGTRTIFINQVPPTGATSFPVGTLMVKKTDQDGKIFARAKRGDDFDPTGAVGWEWFELGETDDGDVVIQWRGFGPPLGEKYGGSTAGCNPCHVLAVANDYVLTSAFALVDAGTIVLPTGDGSTDASPDAMADGDGAAVDDDAAPDAAADGGVSQ